MSEITLQIAMGLLLGGIAFKVVTSGFDSIQHVIYDKFKVWIGFPYPQSKVVDDFVEHRRLLYAKTVRKREKKETEGAGLVDQQGINFCGSVDRGSHVVTPKNESLTA